MKLLKSGKMNRSDIHYVQAYLDRTPRPTEDDYALLKDDILLRRQQKPVCLDQDNQLVDGYTRDQILDELDIPIIKFTKYHFANEAEKFAYIDSSNLKRRHLNLYQKFLVALPDYAEEVKEAQKRMKTGKPVPLEEQGRSTAKAAKKIKMTVNTFERCLTIKKKATPAQESKVIRGTIAIKTMEILLTRADRNLPKIKLPKEISDVFCVDVPYEYKDQGGRAAAAAHFPLMPAQEIIDEFKKINAAKNAIMFFWIAPSMQYDLIPVQYNSPTHQGCAVIVNIPIYKAILDAGGFTVIENEFVWDKEKIGAGNYNRNQHESLLIAIKGKMPLPAELYPSIIKQLRSSFARKPNLWPMIKKMYPKRNYCELYAREITPGVLCHGNELMKPRMKK